MLEDLARQAGFFSKDGILQSATSSRAPDREQIFGMDFVPTPIMPKGWIGMRTEKGVMCVGPSGSFWVPASDWREMVSRAAPLTRS